ncbi:MAG: hypothetical protein HY796_03395 [Elusimicrobia bacterium]|nr:hypothetical protein [Elusimicrobiota bacterium]
MRNYRGLISCFALLGGLFALSLRLSSEWEKKLTVYPEGMDILRAQSAGEGEEEDETDGEETPRPKRIEKGTSQKIWIEKGALNARYNFINFNKDRLYISFSMPSRAYLDYLAGYGYSDADIARLRKWREKTRQNAWDQTIRKDGKAAADKAVADVDLDHETQLRKLMRSRGLALRAGNVVECDMPLIVKRNIPVLKSLALTFQKISSERGYGAEETVGAVISLVQTALRYRIPPSLEGQLHTGGLLPPARALLSGWGDCDTKTGTAAAILGNWSGMRLVGIAVPGHYLMAIRRIPAKGDMFVRYEGLEYVLIEPAGPAWLEPGTVGKNTAALLEGAEGYKVEPFFY